MPDLVDTNILVRYLTGEPPVQSEAAARVLDGEAPIAIAPLILAETAYVLRSVYGVSREDVAAALVDLVQRVNVQVLGVETSLVVQAMGLCRASGRVSFTDALLWAQARELDQPIWTFDKDFPMDGVQIRRP